MRKLARGIARNNMIAAGITNINKTNKSKAGNRLKSKFAQLWRKYTISQKPAAKKAVVRRAVVRSWRRKLWPQKRA